MPVFVCNRCQDTLKAKNLEGHARGCGGTLCCCDCNADFSAASARAHTSCISEAQKYQGALYREGGGKRGGGAATVDPQALWVAQVERAAAAAPAGSRVREQLDQLTALPNVPRKLPKFVNFARNSLTGVRDDATLASLFARIAAEGLARAPPPSAAASGGKRSRPPAISLESTDEEGTGPLHATATAATAAAVAAPPPPPPQKMRRVLLATLARLDGGAAPREALLAEATALATQPGGKYHGCESDDVAARAAQALDKLLARGRLEAAAGRVRLPSS